MRGTTDKALFDKFANAVIGFPPSARDGRSAQQVFEDSYEALDDLATNNPFPRALAWKAYALALSVYERWPLPKSAKEDGMSDQDRLDAAESLAEQAVSQDDTDYDLHWALADVYLIRGKFDQAREQFEIALDLDRDARHPSLYVEAAAAMMQAGFVEAAERTFRRARRPDWHHWTTGAFLFLKAGRAGEQDRESFLNLALEELKSTRFQRGDDFYQFEIQLMLAAVHWRKWELFTQQAAGTTDPTQKAQFVSFAARNMAATERAISVFRGWYSYWTEDVAIGSLSLQEQNDKDWWADTIKALWALPLKPLNAIP